jgi:hypothetical protein
VVEERIFRQKAFDRASLEALQTCSRLDHRWYDCSSVAPFPQYGSTGELLCP